MLSVYVVGAFQDTGTTHRFPVIEHYESPGEVEGVVAGTQDKYQGDPRVQRLFIRDSDGTKYTYKVFEIAEDGIKTGLWEWKEYALAWEDVVLVKNPATCLKCNGFGYITWGRVTVMHRGRPARICFDCSGRGFESDRKG